MILDMEAKAALQKLLDAGVITKAQFDKAISPVIVVSKIKSKFLTLIKYLSLIHWQADIAYFRSKKILIYTVIAGLIYGIAFWHGTINKPVHVNLGGAEFRLVINKDEQLHIYKDGTVILEDGNGIKLHTIKVKDIPALKHSLLPFGFELQPFATVGGSIGTTKQIQPEAGLGADLFKFYKFNVAVWATQYAGYIGGDYYLTNNSGVLLGVGRGWQASDVRLYAGYKWNF